VITGFSNPLYIKSGKFYISTPWLPMATEDVASLPSRDWLGALSEVQFFIHSSSAEPLSVIGVEDTSQYTIQVCAKPLQLNEQVRLLIPTCSMFKVQCFIACGEPGLHKVLVFSNLYLLNLAIGNSSC